MRLLIFGAALVTAGCGNPTIGIDEARKVANLSEDAESHAETFARALMKLNGHHDCRLEAVREFGGFAKKHGSRSIYFTFCDDRHDITTRWYVSTTTGEVSRYHEDL